jgi:transcriptional regulator with XRE-family HTH domain
MPQDETRRQLSHALREGIFHLKRAGYTEKEIGERAGYPASSARQRINQVKNDRSIPSGLRLVKLARLMSEHSFDEVSDLFSAPEKKTVPAAAPDTFRADLCPADELRTITEGAGLASAHIASESLRKAGQQARRAIAGGRALLAEIDAIRAGEGPPIGDGVGTEATVSL